MAMVGMVALVGLDWALPQRRSSAARWLHRITATGRTTAITVGTADIGIMGRIGTMATAGGDGIIWRGIIGATGAAGNEAGCRAASGSDPRRRANYSLRRISGENRELFTSPYQCRKPRTRSRQARKLTIVPPQCRVPRLPTHQPVLGSH